MVERKGLEGPEELVPDDGGSPHKKVAHGASLVFVGTAFGLGLGFLARAIPARLLGPEDYGVLVLGFTVASTVSILAKMGLPSGISRNLPRYDDFEDRRGIIVSAFALSIPVSILLNVLLWGLAEPISVKVFGDPELTNVVRIFSVLIPLLVIKGVVIGSFRGMKRAKERVIIENALGQGLRALLVTTLILLGFGVMGAAIGWVFAILITAGYSIYLLHSSIGFSGVIGGYPFYHRRLLLFSLPLMVSGAMSTLLNQADNLMLGYFLSSSEVGLYDAAFMVGQLVNTPLGIFGFLFMPVFSELHSRTRYSEMDRLHKLVTKWAVSLTLPGFLVIVLFPEIILKFLFGSAYESGALPLIIVASGYFINVLAGLVGQSLISLGMTRLIMFGSVITTIGNLGLNILLIPTLGATGAAAASAISYTGSNLLYLYVLFRNTGIQPLSMSLARSIFYSVLSIVGVQLLVKQLLQVRLWMLPFFFVAFVMVYGFLFLRFGGVEEEDIEIFIAVEDRLGWDLTPVKRVLSRFAGE